MNYSTLLTLGACRRRSVYELQFDARRFILQSQRKAFVNAKQKSSTSVFLLELGSRIFSYHQVHGVATRGNHYPREIRQSSSSVEPACDQRFDSICSENQRGRQRSVGISIRYSRKYQRVRAVMSIILKYGICRSNCSKCILSPNINSGRLLRDRNGPFNRQETIAGGA